MKSTAAWLLPEKSSMSANPAEFVFLSDGVLDYQISFGLVGFRTGTGGSCSQLIRVIFHMSSPGLKMRVYTSAPTWVTEGVSPPA